jgi:hypothetical protein
MMTAPMTAQLERKQAGEVGSGPIAQLPKDFGPKIPAESADGIDGGNACRRSCRAEKGGWKRIEHRWDGPETPASDAYSSHLDDGIGCDRSKSKPHRHGNKRHHHMPFTLAVPVRMLSPVHHANGADDVRYGGDESGLDVRQAEILHDLGQKEAEAPLRRERKKPEDAERQDLRGQHRLEPAHAEERFAAGLLRVQPVLQPFALIGFKPSRQPRSIGQIIEDRKGLVSRVTPVHTALRNCTRDEGRSFEFGNQVLISSHRKLLWSKPPLVNVAEKLGHDPFRHG